MEPLRLRPDLWRTELAAAEAHGRAAEADHEVGDLQDLLRSCWERLPIASQEDVYREHADLLAWLVRTEGT
jgi:hypothetical protein